MAVSGDEPLDLQAVHVDVTLPCDERFRVVVDGLATRMVAYFGYTSGAAERMVDALTRATSGVLAHAGGTAYSSLHLRYATVGGALTIRVRYLRDAGAAPSSSGAGLAEILGAGGEGTPLAALRQVMTRVELGVVDGADCCTLVAPLPEDC